MYASLPTYIPFQSELVGEGKVYRSPMPTETDLVRFKEQCKINRIVQLCFDKEVGYYGGHEKAQEYKELNFEITKFPIEDFKVPKSKKETREFVDELINRLKSGENIVLHCVGGNGRTGLILACLARKIFDMKGPEAVQWVRKYVPSAVEREIQERFVNTYLEDDEPVLERTYAPPRYVPPPTSYKPTEVRVTMPTTSHEYTYTDSSTSRKHERDVEDQTTCCVGCILM